MYTTHSSDAYLFSASYVQHCSKCWGQEVVPALTELSFKEGVKFKGQRGVIAILDFQRVEWTERGPVVGWAVGSVSEEWQLLEEPT